MKLAIFSGIIEGERFFDSYADDDTASNESFYLEDDRHEFSISDKEIEEKMFEIAKDPDRFRECTRYLSISDTNKILHSAYIGDFERELLNDAIEPELRQMAIDDWIEDCLIEVKSKYKEEI